MRKYVTMALAMLAVGAMPATAAEVLTSSQMDQVVAAGRNSSSVAVASNTRSTSQFNMGSGSNSSGAFQFAFAWTRASGS